MHADDLRMVLAATALAATLVGCAATSPGARDAQTPPPVRPSTEATGMPRASPQAAMPSRMLGDLESESSSARSRRPMQPISTDTPQALPVEPRR